MVLREVNYVWLKRKFCKLMKPVPRIYNDKTKDQLFIFRLVHTLVKYILSTIRYFIINEFSYQALRCLL